MPELVGPRAIYRTVTLYSVLEPVAAGPTECEPEGADGLGQATTSRRRPRLTGSPAADLLPSGRYRSFFIAAENQLPRVISTRLWSCECLELPDRGGVRIDHVRTSLFELANGVLVVSLGLNFADEEGESLRAFPDLVRSVDDERDSLRIAGEPLLKACVVDAPDEIKKRVAAASLGPDMHHLMFPSEQAVEGMSDLDVDLLQRVVARRDDASRADYLTVRLPTEANRYPRSLAGVSPGASVVGGHPTSIELSILVSAIQALGSLATLRDIQQRAFRALEGFRFGMDRERDRRSFDEWLARRAEELSELELDLSFGVEAYLSIRLIVPILPVEQFHHELLEALGVRRAAATTGGMVSRLSRAIEAERQAIAAEERGREEERFKREEQRFRTLSAAGGSVAALAIPLTIIFAFLGINAREVRADASLFDLSYYGAYYLALTALPVFAAVVALLYVRFVARR
jgi:hypothetical protein